MRYAKSSFLTFVIIPILIFSITNDIVFIYKAAAHYHSLIDFEDSVEENLRCGI